MAHTYLGVDEPSAIIPGSPTFGYGVFPTPTVTDDQDDRDAASANLAAEADTDRINFLAWRMLNIIEGGLYLFTSLISTFNNWLFRGAVDFYAATKIKSTGSLTSESGSTVTTNGGLAVNGNTVISSTASVLRNTFERRTGAAAWNGSRFQVGVNANVPAFDASTFDVTKCTALSASRTVFLTDPGGSTAMGVEHTFVRRSTLSNAFLWTISDFSDGTTAVPLGTMAGAANQQCFITVCWTGSVWFAVRWGSYTGANAYIEV